MSNIIHPSAQQGFSKNAALYQQARPSYPNEVIHWLKQELKLNHKSRIIDLGAGTGKFIPYLQQVSPAIFAVEPIEEMLDQLTLQYPDIQTIQTDSKNLTLPSQSIDAIVCAQSFHWFANAESLDEIYHVLKPQGSLGLVWNQRDISVDWVKVIADLIEPLEGNTPRFYHGTWQQVFEQKNLFGLESIQKFNFTHRGTVEQVVINRILSTSFVAASSIQQKEQVRRQLMQIIDTYLGKDLHDIIDFPYITYAYHYQKSKQSNSAT